MNINNIIIYFSIAFLIICYSNLGLRYYTTLTGVRIDQYKEKKCAEKWIINTLETNTWEINEITDEEKIKGLPPIKIRLMFSKLLPCISNVKIYNNTKYISNNTVAYVVPKYNNNIMWVVSMKWETMSIEEKAYSIIHECTHLALQTHDYAYVSQEKYQNLRGYNATHNADTLSNIIFKSNINNLC